MRFVLGFNLLNLQGEPGPPGPPYLDIMYQEGRVVQDHRDVLDVTSRKTKGATRTSRLRGLALAFPERSGTVSWDVKSEGPGAEEL